MTTIAYKDGVIAYDSRTSRGDIIVSDTTNKKGSINGEVIFGVGSQIGTRNMKNMYFNGTVEQPLDANLIVVKKGTVTCVGYADKEEPPYIWEESANNCEAWGSGDKFAMGAMDGGATAKEAVKIAAKRDPFTGGKIKEFKIK